MMKKSDTVSGGRVPSLEPYNLIQSLGLAV